MSPLDPQSEMPGADPRPQAPPEADHALPEQRLALVDGHARRLAHRQAVKPRIPGAHTHTHTRAVEPAINFEMPPRRTIRAGPERRPSGAEAARPQRFSGARVKAERRRSDGRSPRLGRRPRDARARSERRSSGAASEPER